MNADLAMGDELLKRASAGNLFMVFGEPDVEITTQKDGRIVAEIKGVDVHDPTTGQICSSSTDDVACGFIDDQATRPRGDLEIGHQVPAQHGESGPEESVDK